MKTKIELPDEAIILLDGKFGPEIQSIVNIVKERLAIPYSELSEEEKKFLIDVKREAINSGKLIYQGKRIRYCDVCGKNAEYAKYPRSGRNHRKGETDWSKQLLFNGIELAERFITMSGYASLGCCELCFNKLLPLLKEFLKTIKAELPDILAGPIKYKFNQNKKCNKCGWTGHEEQMIKLTAIMGGQYPGECPNCHEGNRFLGKTIIEDDKGYTITER